LAKQYKYLYGPINSRRLGRSLGVDIVPFKTCTLGCIYCQLGKTTNKTIRRKEYVPIVKILKEMKSKIKEGLDADYITIGGSGEPCLNKGLGRLIENIKKISDIPVALLTNGTLFYRADVRAEAAKADVVLPSLDAGDEKTFKKVNRPHTAINIKKLISGLRAFRRQFGGKIWLEVFLLEKINTSPGQIKKIKSAVVRIRPDKVQLNTAVRPTDLPGLEAVSYERLKAIANEIGTNCEIIAVKKRTSGNLNQRHPGRSDLSKKLLSVLKRRPCTLNDICSALAVTHNQAVKLIDALIQKGLIGSVRKQDSLFYRAD
jgi:wyosine [tRNA(Phe)-imidazoG37] synthetase (radical SAM superfamily)